jgi:HK97 family phage prohead protease
MSERETRSTPLALPEGRTLAGYAARYNSRTTIGDMFVEVIAPGAFRRALSADVHAVLNHDWGRVIGRTESGTLRLSEDSNGLRVEIDLPDTADGQTALELVKRRDLTGMSFSFIPLVEEWDDSGPLPVRTLKEVEIFEVSIVARPAYPDTSIALRGLERQRASVVVSGAARAAKARMKMAARERGLIGRR